jgi:probable HAF family extracellular repeat protein
VEEEMKLRGVTRLCGIGLFAGLMAITITTAQEAKPKAKHHRYKVVDVGTFGGPNADTLVPPPAAQILTNNGIFVGTGETKLPDPFPSACFNPDCFLRQPLLWVAGSRVHLPSLRHGYSGGPISVNDFAVAVGFAENGEIDPLVGTPKLKATLWKDGKAIDLGTLGGNGASANAINNRGQIFGGALNTIRDPDPFFPFFVPGATQVHAVLWEHGAIKDLGTLGGTDSVVYQANDAGQAMGISFSDDVIHEFIHDVIPDIKGQRLATTHPFLWEDGKMHDVGSLGGNFSQGFGLNGRGEVVGRSLLERDATEHPFLWRHGMLRDLGTLGGDNGEAWAINDQGHAVGRADLPGSQSHHAFLWRNRQMKDLGAPHSNTCSTGETINRFDQVVGDSGECGVGGDPFLWEDDNIVAIRDLLVPGSERFVFDAFDINDQGEIVSYCATPQGHVHVCLLMPVGEPTSELATEDLGKSSTIIPSAGYPKTGERRISIPEHDRGSLRDQGKR